VYCARMSLFTVLTLPHPIANEFSYTFFEYSELSLSTKLLKYNPVGRKRSWKVDDETLTVSISVKNKGGVDGFETVFFFTFDEARSTTPEYKRLRAFEKVFIPAGGSRIVSAKLPSIAFKIVGAHDDAHYVIEHGLRFYVGVGSNTDCRTGRDSALCSGPITIDAGEDYIAACEHSCELWANSGCAEEFQLSPNKCWALCTSVSQNNDVAKYLGEGEDGW
jgi:hypothetical protein